MKRILLLAALAACSRAQVPAARPGPDVEAVLAGMTLDEKIGQMTQADHGTLKLHPEDVRDLFLGSVLSGGDSLPEPNEARTWADVTDRYHALAAQTRLAIPLLYGVDAVHGHNGLRGAVIFPHNIGLGATRNAARIAHAHRQFKLHISSRRTVR